MSSRKSIDHFHLGAKVPPRLLGSIQSSMRRDGAVAFDSIFPLPLLKRIRALVLRRHESGELRRNGLIRDIGGRYAAVLPFEGPFLSPAFYANERLHAVVSALLGADYCIGSLETVISLPGSSPQHQHIDGPIRFDTRVGKKRAFHVRGLAETPPYAIGLATPLCDVREENGPTAIWRGSHLEALLPRPPGEAVVRRRYPEDRLAGRFGFSYLFDYRVFHGGLANMSREVRPLLMTVFVRSWFRDPNLVEVDRGVVIKERDYRRVPESRKPLFALAAASRRKLWPRW
ncbi:MAG: phytanoyl-CoA dioxygenase family protein [Elusimicrobia bacterium]|nr:phytanoyl-CoA dioxygenase family protein [Elusimicrobiota bacterium]